MTEEKRVELSEQFSASYKAQADEANAVYLSALSAAQDPLRGGQSKQLSKARAAHTAARIAFERATEDLVAAEDAVMAGLPALRAQISQHDYQRSMQRAADEMQQKMAWLEAQR